MSVSINFPICTVESYVSLCLMIFLCPFLHCKALRTAMYMGYINSIIIIIIIIVIIIIIIIIIKCEPCESMAASHAVH